MLVEMSDCTCVRNICYLRQKYAVSRRGLSKLMGISVYTLRGLEEGTIPPLFKSRELMRLCAIFDITMETLVHTDLAAQEK